jgi:hypothetical protein
VIHEYQELLEQLEDLQALNQLEEAKASGETAVPFEDATARIERSRR